MVYPLLAFRIAVSAAADDWRTAALEEVGIDSGPLVEMFDFIRDRQIPVHSVQLVREGRLVLDAYFYPFEPDARHDVASVTKSITSLLVGVATDKGALTNVRQRLSDAFPDRRPAHFDERKAAITLEHLLCMTAGWDCGLEPKEQRLFEMRRSADWLQFMLDLPMMADPGTRWAYCSGNCHVLSMLLSRVTGSNALAFGRQHLFGRLRIDDVAWPADRDGDSHGWGDLQLRPRDMAKIGQLMLQRGRWGEREVLSEAWVAASTSPQVKQPSNRDHYGYFWWVKGADFPGMFEAVGRGGQRITVWPARELVVVFTGGGFEPGELAPFLLKAIKTGGPLPPNRTGARELRQRLAAARKAPQPKRAGNVPALARTISGKTFRLSPNGMQLGRVQLNLRGTRRAHAVLVWQGQHIAFPVGLDGVPRFSLNPITKLRQAAMGEWVGAQTLLLDLDLVGGVNRYRIQLRFPNATEVEVSVSERTGLGEEVFHGTAE